MEKNKLKIVFVLLAIIFILGLTFYKIVKNREEKLYDVLYGEIEYQAKKCFLNGDCKDSTTLEELYKLNYLNTKYDPITKEILDSKIIIEYKDEKIIINK